MTYETDPSLDTLVSATRHTARQLMIDAESIRDRAERSTRRRFARLLQERSAVDVTISLTDEVMRIASISSAARSLRVAAARATVAGFGWFNTAGLRAISSLSRLLPSAAVKVVHWRVRSYSGAMILPAENPSFQRHVRARQSVGLCLNVNVLGEAVLGEREANERLERVLEMMGRSDVNYVSIKLSSVVSQLVVFDHAGSLERVSSRLRVLFRRGQREGVFINLDMEEFRDLRLTVDAFQSVLDEPEFDGLSAGIVLQAYLPDSHGALEGVIEWALRRHERSGAHVKVRLVKGANLAMEHVEAQLHGWTAAPFASKAEVDASYARLLDIGLRSAHAQALRVGVASHNLFHVTWALAVAERRGVMAQLDVEMLEGMANAEALTLVRSGVPVLLYVPVTRRDDFSAAVAYLVRRLDENTSDENYLKAAFFIAKDQEVFAEQEERFLQSITDRHRVDTGSRRHAHRAPFASDAFENVADGDPTDPTYVGQVTAAVADVLTQRDREIALALDDDDGTSDDFEEGRDPNDGGRVWYRYRVANTRYIDRAVENSRSAGARWEELGCAGRRAILWRFAEIMERQRATAIALMARDAGKTVAEADPEVSEAIDFARFYSDRSGGFSASTPLGVVLVVPPWNFPYAIATGGVCAALAAGNAVILKPAPEAVAVASLIVEQLWEAGVPRDVVQFVPTRDDDCGRRLVTHEGVDGVVLTGSFETAKLFTTWRPEINLLAETSGKNAMLITSYADIDLAVKDLVQSAFGHAGQKCSAASLAIVDRSIYDHPAFLRQLTDSVQSLQVGPGYNAETIVGPIIRGPEVALRRALTQLEPGEQWLVAPAQVDGTGLLWRPGVKIGVQPGSWSHLNEWFGPVLAVIPAPDFATGLEWQNRVPYGLTAGLQSLDEVECQYWIDHVEAGNLYVNRGTTGAVVRRQPFGGWKRSSVGPSAKAGGANYVGCLRRWGVLDDEALALESLASWWRDDGSLARDWAGLDVEANTIRYRDQLAPTVVRVDESFAVPSHRFVEKLSALTGAPIVLSSSDSLHSALPVRSESVDELVERCSQFARVRWLSAETAPTVQLLEHGLTVDARPLAQDGAIEGPRWFLEQSVAVTHHRYGNVHAGPSPVCRGLAALRGEEGSHGD